MSNVKNRFAYGTKVPAAHSRAEIEHLLQKYGADQFVSGYREGQAVLGFRMRNRNIRFLVPMPSSEENAEQRMRERWRAMVLVLKAKLEAVTTGITSFDEEFLAHIYMPDGKTIGDHMLPQIESAYKSGKMSKMLPGF